MYLQEIAPISIQTLQKKDFESSSIEYVIEGLAKLPEFS